ncbi:hypothetical protein Tco_1568880 [Tanacetum coccineum]
MLRNELGDLDLFKITEKDDIIIQISEDDEDSYEVMGGVEDKMANVGILYKRQTGIGLEPLFSSMLIEIERMKNGFFNKREHYAYNHIDTNIFNDNNHEEEEEEADGDDDTLGYKYDAESIYRSC